MGRKSRSEGPGMARVAASAGRAPGMAGRQEAVIRGAFWTAAGLGVSIHAAHALAGGRGRSRPIDDWLYCGLYLLAAAACAGQSAPGGRGPGPGSRRRRAARLGGAE